MAGFEESILTVLVLVGFGVGALIMSKVGGKNGNKKAHRRRSHRA